MKRIILIIITIGSLYACSEKPERSQSVLKHAERYVQRIDSLLTTLLSNHLFMGSVSITKNGKIVYSRAFGVSDLNKGLKANTNTKYRIGSITKTFTAVLAFKAVEENKIRLDQTIDSFFPKLMNGNSISIAHLLHHQSGIQSYTKDKYFWENRTQKQTSQDLMNVIYNLERSFKPGNNTQYSNSNYFLLTQLLEKVYEDSYANLLRKYIVSPLQLKNTFVGEKIRTEKNEGLSYIFKDDTWDEFSETHLSLAKGSGSIVSTPNDLNIFFRSLLNGNIISPENLEKMTTIIGNHGMGIFKYNLNDQSGFGHGGNIDGFKANAIYFRDIDVALSITSNASTLPIDQVYSQVLELYLGQPKLQISEKEVEPFVGIYASLENPSEKVVFQREGNTLILVILEEFKEPLIYKGNRRFLFNQMHGESISFTFSEDGKELTFDQGDFLGKYKKQ